MALTRALTTLGDFGRGVRNEPAFGVYPYKIYVTKDDVRASEVHAWLKMRYMQSRKGNMYRVVTYRHNNGTQYVDFIWMQTCSDKDIVEIRMRWGYSSIKVSRGERIARRKLTRIQRKALDARIAQLTYEFYESLES